MSNDYKFTCPSCEQPFTARYEHIGMIMTCPACETDFPVPNFLKAAILGKEPEKLKEISAEEIAATRHANSPIFNSFTSEQLLLLDDEDANTIEPLKGLRHRNRWELGMMAALLSRRLLPLKQTIFDTPHEQILQSGWKSNKPKYHQFLRAFCLDYFKIINSLQQTLAGPFHQVLTGQNLDDLFVVANQLYEIFTKLMDSYERCFLEPIPKEDDYIQLHTLIAGWSADCCRSLLLLREKLSEGCTVQRDTIYIAPQVSVTPTNLHSFMRLSHRLGVGFEKPKTVMSYSAG